MNIKEAFEQYQNAEDFIANFFGGETYYGIEFHLDNKWYDWGSEVGWFDDGEDIYSFEIYGSMRWERDGYVMFVGDDGCGNRGCYIFSLEHKCTMEEWDMLDEKYG
jgi:hypothetical protein